MGQYHRERMRHRKITAVNSLPLPSGQAHNKSRGKEETMMTTTVTDRETQTAPGNGTGNRERYCEGCPRCEDSSASLCSASHPKFADLHPKCKLRPSRPPQRRCQRPGRPSRHRPALRPGPPVGQLTRQTSAGLHKSGGHPSGSQEEGNNWIHEVSLPTWTGGATAWPSTAGRAPTPVTWERCC